MQQTTKNFNEKMTQLMKQFLEFEKEALSLLLKCEKRKAQNLMKESIRSEELTLKENWELLFDKNLVTKQSYTNQSYQYGFQLNDIYAFKDGSDYAIRFVDNQFRNEFVKDVLRIHDFNSEYESLESFYDLN